MADETNTVTTDLCEACGADVRPDSQFCYNCGGSLEKRSDPPSDVVAQETRPNTASNGSGSPAVIKEGPGLTSAASIHQRSKTLPRKPVQISWEPMDQSSDWILLIVSAALFVIVLLVVGIALYFK